MAIQSFSVGQVLTAAQVNALQANDYNQTVSNKTGSYTLVAADKGTRITMSSTSATTITVNTSLFSAGDTLFIQNVNTGVSTITAGTATVTTSASLALAQWEGGTLYFTSASAAIFFKSDGAAASSGGMTLISETVASALSSLTFGSISGSFKQLYLVWGGVRHSTTGSAFSIRLNNDSSSIYATMVGGQSTSTNTVEGTTTTQISNTNFSPFGKDADLGITETNNLVVDAKGYLIIDNYASSTKAKTYYGQWNCYDNSAGVYRIAQSNIGIFKSTTAITSIDVFRTAGSATFSNVGDTTIRLYGVA